MGNLGSWNWVNPVLVMGFSIFSIFDFVRGAYVWMILDLVLAIWFYSKWRLRH
jgi:hypothetical protein